MKSYCKLWSRYYWLLAVWPSLLQLCAQLDSLPFSSSSTAASPRTRIGFYLHLWWHQLSIPCICGLSCISFWICWSMICRSLFVARRSDQALHHLCNPSAEVSRDPPNFRCSSLSCSGFPIDHIVAISIESHLQQFRLLAPRPILLGFSPWSILVVSALLLV